MVNEFAGDKEFSSCSRQGKSQKSLAYNKRIMVDKARFLKRSHFPSLWTNTLPNINTGYSQRPILLCSVHRRPIFRDSQTQRNLDSRSWNFMTASIKLNRRKQTYPQRLEIRESGFLTWHLFLSYWVLNKRFYKNQELKYIIDRRGAKPTKDTKRPNSNAGYFLGVIRIWLIDRSSFFRYKCIQYKYCSLIIHLILTQWQIWRLTKLQTEYAF